MVRTARFDLPTLDVVAVRSLPIPFANDPRITSLMTRAVRPLDLIAQLAAEADVVFLAERHGVRQFLEFLIDNVAEFARMGFTSIAMEFGAVEVQSQLDALVQAPHYDARRVRELMFEYNVAWPFVEYQDVARAVWAYNQVRPTGAPVFRVLNLSYRYNWRGWDGSRSPESLRKVQYFGPIDIFRANVLEREVFGRHTKSLALMGEPHALRSNVWPHPPAAVAGFIHPHRAWTAQVVEDRHPGRVRSVWLHTPVQDGEDMALPCHGMLDALALAEGPYGLLTPFDSEAGDLPLGSTFIPGITLAEAVDAVLSFGPVRDLRPCAIDHEFATHTNWHRVLDDWPDSDWNDRPSGVAQYYIERAASFEYPEAWGIDRH